MSGLVPKAILFCVCGLFLGATAMAQGSLPLKLDPAFAQNLTGTGHTVVATYRDSNGNPVAGAPVNFIVISGPNQGVAGNDFTNASGVATFTYSSQLPGLDAILATDGRGQASNVVQKQWFTPGPNETCNGLDDNGDGSIDDGFPDRDGDGVADCVDPDDDNDGVADGQDNCPLTSNHDQADANQNGIGDACESGAPPIVNPPTPIAIQLDGQFGPPTAEWFGVTPATFLAGNSKVYTAVDPSNNAIFLMYDVSTNTPPLALGDRIGPVSFQVGAGSFFDVFVIQGGPDTEFGPNPPTSTGGVGDQVEVFLNGVPFDNSAGCVVGAVDHNTTSPNFAPAHNLVELRIALTGNPGGCYSPEPAFWSATLPTVQPGPGATRAQPTLLELAGTDPDLVSAAFVTIAPNGTTTIVPAPELVTAVGPELAVRTGVLLASPNPFRDQTAILLTLPKAEEVEVSVTDVSGRLLWRSPRAPMAAGQHRIPWYGQDDSGRHVHAGLYFVQVRGASGLKLRRTVIRLQ